MIAAIRGDKSRMATTGRIDAALHSVTRHGGGGQLPRHRHAQGYAALVLAGGYVEAGDGGRWLARPGTVLIHGAHEAHRDLFMPGRTIVLNLPLAGGLAAGAGMIDDVDAVARAAERDPIAAAQLVSAGIRRGAHRLADWPDLLADALADDPALGLADWADRIGLAPASVSRGFARTYGVSPKRYRLEVRARRALAAVATTGTALADIAADHGFADQAHMTRAIMMLTGGTPGAFRAKSVQSASDGSC